MGAITALLMTWLAAVGVYKLFTQRDFRKSLFAEFLDNPLELTFVLALCACMLLFFWGVLIPALGTIKVSIMGKRYELWAVAGLASLAGFAIMMLYSWLRARRP